MKLPLFQKGLLQKGLLVISIVLAIQLGFLSFYGWLLQQAEFLGQQEFHSKAVLARSNYVSALLMASDLAGLVYAVTQDKEARDIYRDGKAKIPAELAGLKEVIQDDQDQEKRLEKSNALINETFAALDDAAKQNPLSLDKKHLQDLTKLKLLPIWRELFQLRRAVIKSDFERYKIIEIEANPKAVKTRKDSVWILIIIDLIGAAGLLYFYTHGLTTRLAVLSDNANRFARKEKLNPPVGGSDEITNVDQAFHSMSASLHLAQKRKQEFVSMISHDMRTPLSNVQASLEFVLEGHQEPLGEETKLWLNRAYGNVDTVLRLINELLEIERIEDGALTLDIAEAQVSDLIRKSVDAVQALADQHSISIVTPKTDAYLPCDQDRLVRVLVNLLGNALKFSPDNSTITIGCSQAGQCLELTVSDTGRGIPEDLINSIFERFKQVSPDDARQLGGAGLGLAISKAIVEAHGGKIDVKSQPGKGSTFRISLPFNKNLQQS